MYEDTLHYLKCVKCQSDLELNIFSKFEEVEEGLIECLLCHKQYPIISKIPIMWNDLSSFLSNRAMLGGSLLNKTKNPILKNMIKKAIQTNLKNSDDITNIENRWVLIYKNSRKSKFYQKVKSVLNKIPKSDSVVEYGCSIGNITNVLSKNHEVVFGVDQSFFAILEAKKNQPKNTDYIVSNLLCQPLERESLT